MFKPEIKDQAAGRIAATLAAKGDPRAYPMPKRVALALYDLDDLALSALSALAGLKA